MRKILALATFTLLMSPASFEEFLFPRLKNGAT